MASLRYALLAAILITICLDVSSIVAIAAAVAWDSKMSRYVDSYNLDRGPVFYKAYYPDTRDAYQEKRHLDRNTVLEASFQVPFERFAYSAETADRPVSTRNESFVVVDNGETLPREQQKTADSRRNYDGSASQLAPFRNERSTIFDDAENPQLANIEEISELVIRAISHDLENWNALEGYLDRTVRQRRPVPQLEMHSGGSRENKEGGSYTFPINRRSSEVLLSRKWEARDTKRGSTYLEGVDANENRMTDEVNVGETQAVDTPPSIDVISDPLPPDNIFQPRPQLIRYTFFKKPEPPRFDERTNEKAIDESTPRTYGDNLIRGEIANGNRGRQAEENVKVTSIEVSKLPRHKTRHHHDEWPKRDYSIHRHRSQSVGYPTVS